jgi:predicted glycoside hydrolase/deacetylase ChbG (UPF0249 family)
MKFNLTADDAGSSIEVDRAILDSISRGNVNSVSYLVNGDSFDSAREQIGNVHGIRRSLHLNVVEGKPLALGAESPLVSESGYFAHQATGLLRTFWLAGPKLRTQIVRDIEKEWGAQVDKFTKSFSTSQSLNIDSHQHVHVFPFAFEALRRAITERDLYLGEIRFPSESFWPAPSLHNIRYGYAAPNALKRLLLNRYSRLAKGQMKYVSKDFFGSNFTEGHITNAFCGVLLSGHMTTQVCIKFLNQLDAMTELDVVEILLHQSNILLA